MKKSLASKIAVVIVALCIMASCIAVSAYAATLPTLSLSSSVNGSNQVEVILTVSDGADLATIQAEIKYDTSVVTYKGSEYLAGQQNATNSTVAGIALINDIWKESTNTKTDIVKLTFTVNAGVSAADAAFSIGNVTATDSNDAAITFGDKTGTTVNVTATTTTAAATTTSSSSSTKGNTNGKSPATAGTIAASLAGVAVAAAGAAVAVIVIKKKNNAK